MILKYLNHSYPLVENRWKIILPISVFVCLFMVIFQPFGLDDYTGPDKFFILAGYGLITFISCHSSRGYSIRTKTLDRQAFCT